MYTEEINKVVLSSNDNMRIQTFVKYVKFAAKKKKAKLPCKV